MTLEEFERLPERPGKQELLKGELIEEPPPKKRHGDIAKKLFVLLFDAVERNAVSSGAVEHQRGYCVAGSSWLIPDVSITHPNQQSGDYYEGAPLLAVEVVSPSNTATYVAAKVHEYLAHGSREVWVLYPELRLAWVHRKEGAVSIEGTLTSDLLPGLSIDLAALFA